MIEQNKNIKHDRKIKRLVEVNEHAKQINVLDSRYYQRAEGVFYPSVTSVLNYFPKDRFFEMWKKDVGHNIDIILRRAANEGTQVHTAIEKYINGEEITWMDEWGNTKYSLEVWKMIMKFVDFWETYKPEVVATEEHLFSDELKVAGTCDLVCRIDGELWLIDFKTSNMLAKTYDLQLAAYTQAWNEIYEEKIQRQGILWLKSSKRGAKEGRVQGHGWELKESTEPLETNLELFRLIYEMYKLMNPEMKPLTETLPTVLTPTK